MSLELKKRDSVCELVGQFVSSFGYVCYQKPAAQEEVASLDVEGRKSMAGI